MGNRRNRCSTCNRFVQAVTRLVAKRLAERHQEEQAEIRASVEFDLYPQFVEEYRRQYPILAVEDIDFDEAGRPIIRA